MSAGVPAVAPNLVHNVFFALHDNSPEACQKLVEACHKYLTNHEGLIYFSAGLLSQPYQRPVNDRDFDVSVHLVFRTTADHDRYQTHPRHVQFMEENRANWKKARVFDSEVLP